MAFDSAAPLAQLATLVGSLVGMQRVYTGVPESMSNQVSAYVACAGQRIVDKATGLLQREARYLVVFGYRVKGAEQTAETTVAGLIDALIAEVYHDRTLNGTGRNATVDATLADTPLYQQFAGQELRLYPCHVVVTQEANYP